MILSSARETRTSSDFRRLDKSIPKTVVSLFSGCGGLDLGFKESGFELLYACDSDPKAVSVYSRNIDEQVYLRDVKSAEFQADVAAVRRCDVVLGGFPCQGFSKAGPKRPNDERNALYLEMLYAVERLQPSIFIAENVDGISQNFNGAYVKKITSDFAKLGYQVDHHILDAIQFGLPQYRRRVLFVGVKSLLHADFVWPTPTHEALTRNGDFKVRTDLPLLSPLLGGRQRLQRPQRICDAIPDLLSLDSRIPDHLVTYSWPDKYESIFKAIRQGQKLCNVRHARSSVYTWNIPEVFGAVTDQDRVLLETIAKHRRHKKYGNIPNGNPLPCDEIERLSGLVDIERDLGRLVGQGYLKTVKGGYDLRGAQFCSGLFKRPSWDEPSPTVLTNFHNPRYFLHPLEDRPFSLRECARLQGFPDCFVFTHSSGDVDLVSGYRLIGNAVPPPVSRVLADATSRYLNQFTMTAG